MENVITVVLTACVLLSASQASAGGFAMSFRPGLSLNGTHFGYEAGPVFIGAGLEFAYGGINPG